MSKMKFLSLLLGLFMMASCKGQTDLYKLKVDEKISFDTSKLEKNSDPVYGLKGYRTDDLSLFKIENISLQKYEIPNGNAGDYSELYVFVNSYEENKFIGFYLNSVNEEEQGKILEFLKRAYKEPKFSSNDASSISMAWFDDNENKWILLEQNNHGLLRNGKSFKAMDIIVVKQGTKIEGDERLKGATIWDMFKFTHFSK
ncbi:hypothetical protein QEG73_23060 [Chitinophagaceae bacterium 26-R-25]|nr:hypothetical protein [Chitinophagaceae bacterium 26-R-25]